MFYYPLVLRCHTGCFSTIWLVATKAIRVPRRDFLKVDVKNTCRDILSYILEQVPPPLPGLPRPRFSLYLSSQLQYGLVVVFHRQCVILLEDLQSILKQLLKQKKHKKIDMEDQGRPALDMADELLLLEDTEGAPDPLFGVMQDAWLSPSALAKRAEEYHREATPPGQPGAASSATDSYLMASPDAITLPEEQPVAVPAAEFQGEELMEQHQDTLDALLAQPDHFFEGDLEVLREQREVERVRGEAATEKKKKRPSGPRRASQPPALPSEDADLRDARRSAPPTEQRTPSSAPTPPPPLLPPAARRRKPPASQDQPPPPAAAEEEEEEERRRKRRRQLIFFDPVTQVPQEDLRRQLDDPRHQTRRLPLPPPPPRRLRPAAELLDNPCTLLPEEVQFLWKRAARVTPVAGSDLQTREWGPASESTDSERERREEVPREAPDVSDPGSLPLEASGREISPMITPDVERSSIIRSVSALTDIPEVQHEFLERAAAEAPGLQPELGEPGECVVFNLLIPPEADRRTVSSAFQRLLEYSSAGKLSVQQGAPYGDILVSPGPSALEEELQLF